MEELACRGIEDADTRILTRARTTWLRRLFTAVVVVLALQMLYKGVTGSL